MYRIFILLAALLICFGCTTEFDRQLEAVKEILKANNMDPELARSIADKLNENVYSICIQDDSLRVISDAIGRLPKVRYLNLNFNKIEFISEEIGKCTSLVEIELVGNNLKKLPESIGNLKNLEILELRANQLEELPESFGNLQKLRELSLQRNRLKRLPESYGNLNTGGHLNDNQLETLPESFANLKISEIDLINNNIKIFPFKALFPRKPGTYFRIGLKDNPLDLSTIPPIVRKYCPAWKIGAVDFARNKDSIPYICGERVTDSELVSNWSGKR